MYRFTLVLLLVVTAAFVNPLVGQEKLPTASTVAQVSVPTTPIPKDELVQAWIDTVKVATQFANSECQQLASMKQLNALRADAQRKIEARLPGYSINWQTFSVVEKKPVTPAK